MKGWKSILMLAAMLCMASACPKDRAAYETLRGTKAAAETAVSTAAKLHASGNITDADWFKVETVHDDKFVPAFNTAVELAAQDYTQPTPVIVRTYLTELLQLVETLRKD